MAAFTSRQCCRNMARGVVGYVLLVVAVTAGARRANEARCLIADFAVFPYWSPCSNPAVYANQGGVYKVADPRSGLLLAPEWDETNSTYYIRLANAGATYALSHRTFDVRSFVTLSRDLIFTNVDTGRALGWRNEGEGEDFLVEVDIEARFEFAANNDVNLFCPHIYPPVQCRAYSILAFNSTSGLAPYDENGATYFKKSTTDLFAFVLERPSSTSLRKNMISSVV